MSRSRHWCPGRCGRSVRNNIFACRRCWGQLPTEFRHPLLSTNGKRRSTSLAKRRAWTLARGYFDTHRVRT